MEVMGSFLLQLEEVGHIAICNRILLVICGSGYHDERGGNKWRIVQQYGIMVMLLRRKS